MRALFATLLVLLSNAAPAEAQQCDCGRAPTPCAGFWGATTVFVGRVDGVARERGLRRVTFAVLDRHKGSPPNRVVVRTGPAGERCSLSFRPGQEYLVYAKSDEGGGLTTNMCLRTPEIEDAAADLAYARALEEGKAPPGRISGQVAVFGRDLSGRVKGPGTPAAEVTVNLVKDGREWTTTTNIAGDFAFEVSEPGRYQVLIAAPDRYYVDDAPGFVDLRDARACAEIDRQLHDNGRIAGRVVDAAGRPVAGLTIELAPVVSGLPIARVLTSSAGSYELTHLPPGRFLLGLNLSPRRSSVTSSPRVFHPGVEKLTAATKLALTAGGVMTLGDFRLSSKTRYVGMPGVVFDSDGVPAAGARVFVKGADDDATILAEPAVTDGFGRFVVAGLDGMTYRLFAERTRVEGQRHQLEATDQVAVTVTAGLTPVRLTLRRRY